MKRYHVTIDLRQTLGGMFRMMDSKYVHAENEADARAQVKAMLESPKHCIASVAAIETFEVTFRNKKDKRQRDTWVVEAEKEKTAIDRAKQLAYHKFVPESTPIKVVQK